jgi:GNAT superfamily N-acetyltransferase
LDASGLPFSVVLRSKLADQAKAQLSCLGFSIAYTSGPMQLNMESFLPHSVRKDYKLKCTDKRLTDWAIPLESAFESEQKVIRQYQTQHQIAINTGKQLFHFSLYVKTNPVCSLTLSIQNRSARLDDIGTKTEFQGQGYASALIQYALEYAMSQNVSQCFLEASNEGVSIYKRIGFSDLFEYTCFSSKVI